MKDVMKVYKAIADVTAKLAKDGISKDRKNVAQGYNFRGIDDVYNALAPYLAEAKLCILPQVVSREVAERTNQKGTVLFYVTVQVKFCFVSAEDGSQHDVVTYGEAMDSGDKATNKAMSAAYKYAAMQAFCIPTEGDNDADATTHHVSASPARGGRGPSPSSSQPDPSAPEEAPVKVDAAQIAAIEKSLATHGVDKLALLMFAEIGDISELAASDGAKAIRWIEKQKRAAA